MVQSFQVPKKLPVLFVTDGVCFPGGTVRIPVQSKQNIKLVEECLLENLSSSQAVIALAYKNPTKYTTNDMHPIGTAAIVSQVIGSNWPKISYNLQITGICRVKFDEIHQTKPYRVAEVAVLDRLNDISLSEGETQFFNDFMKNVDKLLSLIHTTPAISQLKRVIQTAKATEICDLVTGIVESDYTTRLDILDAVNINERIKLVNEVVLKHIRKSESMSGEGFTKIDIPDQSVRVDHVSKIINNLLNNNKIINNKPFNIDKDGKNDELEQKLLAAGMPEEVSKMVFRELKKLNTISSHSPEYSGLRSYLELMSELPWKKETVDSLNTLKAKCILDSDHFGLESVKKRVLEFVAVRQLRQSLKGPILCFVGPPGVGKTSIAKSIAATLGRKFHRISVGGVCDQSDIRGHRRTYIGSMPGRIIQGLNRVQTNNPVFLLDEVDKITRGMHGDPSAALLEVLDPEQNNSFVDHYVNAPFDLSNVLFLATANSTSTIPAALRDRMEIIAIPGYSAHERVQIAIAHLVPKQISAHGLSNEHVTFPSQGLKFIVERYTREPGVRSLERKIGALCRAVALKVATARSAQAPDKIVDSLDSNTCVTTELPVIMDEKAIEDILGPPTYFTAVLEDLNIAGISAGLVVYCGGGWGSIIYVEATCTPGSGKLTLTGQLGSVMKESANVAINWVKSRAKFLSLDPSILSGNDVHMHFPEGAVDKDGPSAGIAIVAALVSLFSDKPVRSDTAMTGEISLRGLVLPVGGVKEKLLAAHRAGFRRVIIPQRNQKDVKELPQDVQNEITVIPVQTIFEALQEAFDKNEEVKILSKL